MSFSIPLTIESYFHFKLLQWAQSQPFICLTSSGLHSFRQVIFSLAEVVLSGLHNGNSALIVELELFDTLKLPSYSYLTEIAARIADKIIMQNLQLGMWRRHLISPLLLLVNVTIFFFIEVMLCRSTDDTDDIYIYNIKSEYILLFIHHLCAIGYHT